MRIIVDDGVCMISPILKETLRLRANGGEMDECMITSSSRSSTPRVSARYACVYEAL